MGGSNNQRVNLRSGVPFFCGPVFRAKITSAKFIAKKANVQDQRSFQHSKGLVFHKERGRSCKCEDFPDLAGILEFAFGEGDRMDRAGGGLESHPRLTDTVLYRAADSNTVMRQRHELQRASKSASPLASITHKIIERERTRPGDIIQGEVSTPVYPCTSHLELR